MAIRETFFNGATVPLRLCRSGRGANGILFVHGNSCSANDWFDQLNDPDLQNKYQLAAFDLPGHGRSGRSSDYSLAEMADAIVSVAGGLEWEATIVVGISLGTAYVAEAVPKLDGLKGVVMLSSNVTNNQHPPTSYLKMVPGIVAAFSTDAPEDLLRTFAENLAVAPDDPVVNDFITSYRHTDGNLRVAVAKAAQNGEWTDEFANLEQTGKPVLFVFGEKERVLDINYVDDLLQVPGFRKELIPGAAHFVNKDQPGLLNERLLAFADSCFR